MSVSHVAQKCGKCLPIYALWICEVILFMYICTMYRRFLFFFFFLREIVMPESIQQHLPFIVSDAQEGAAWREIERFYVAKWRAGRRPVREHLSNHEDITRLFLCVFNAMDIP